MNSFKFKKLWQRLVALFLISSIGGIVVLGSAMWAFSREQIEDLTIARLKAIADGQFALIENSLDTVEAELTSTAAMDPVRSALIELNTQSDAGSLTAGAYESFRRRLHSTLSECREHGGCYDVLLVNKEGDIVYTTRAASKLGTNIFASESAPANADLSDIVNAAIASGSIEFSHYASNENNSYASYWAAPIAEGGEYIGSLVYHLDETFYSRLIPLSGNEIGQTGEIVLATMIDGSLTVIAPLRHVSDAPFNMTFAPDADLPITRAIAGDQGAGPSVDYRDEPIYAIWYYLPNPEVAMVVKMDAAEVLAPLDSLGNWFVINLTAAVLLAIILARLVASSIATPISALASASKRLAQGIDLQPLPVNSSMAEEIADLIANFNNMQTSLTTAKNDLLTINQELESRINVRTQELKKLNDQLNEALANLQESQASTIQTEKMASLGTLAAGVGHEINNPLMGIINYIEYARDHVEDDRTRDILTKAEVAVERIKKIVQNMMSYSRRSTEEMESVDLRHVAEEVIDLLATELRHANIIVDVDIETNLPLAQANRNEVSQCLLNILLNATHALAQTESAHIQIELRSDASHVMIRTADNGPGVPKEIQERIFDPFFTTKEVGKSTGLGLSVTKNLVEKFGGTLRYFDAPGGGAGFEIALVPVGGLVAVNRSSRETDERSAQ